MVQPSEVQEDASTNINGIGQNANDDKPEHDEAPLPPLTTIAPAIFVPITTDFLEPFTPPRTRIDRLHAIIAQVDAHSAGVRENLLSLFRQECVRLQREGRSQEAKLLAEKALPPPARPGAGSGVLAPDELAEMLSRMHTPAGPNDTFDIPDADIPVPNFKGMLVGTPREWSYRELMTVVTRAIGELKDFEDFVARTRSVYEIALQRELEREAE